MKKDFWRAVYIDDAIAMLAGLFILINFGVMCWILLDLARWP